MGNNAFEDYIREWQEKYGDMSYKEVIEKKNKVLKLCCLYQAKTELYDRSLTDKRSRHDVTEAYLTVGAMVNLSNKYAIELRERIVDYAEKELRIERCEFLKMFNQEIQRHHYSAQGWIDMYNHFKDNGEMEFINE